MLGGAVVSGSHDECARYGGETICALWMGMVLVAKSRSALMRIGDAGRELRGPLPVEIVEQIRNLSFRQATHVEPLIHVLDDDPFTG